MNLNGLCDVHHDEKTHRGARLEVTDTERRWWPPPSPPGSVPWCAPIGEHLSRWNLDHPPDESHDDPADEADGRLPFD